MQMQSLSRREVIVFAAAALFAVWAVVKLCFGLPGHVVEQQPHVRDVRPAQLAERVDQMIAAPDLAAYWAEGDRGDPFAPIGGYPSYLLVESEISAVIAARDRKTATLTMSVAISYRILSEPVDTLRVELPRDMEASGFPTADATVAYEETSRRRVAVLKFRRPLKDFYRLRFLLQRRVSLPSRVAIPPIRVHNAEAQSGYIGITPRGLRLGKPDRHSLQTIRRQDWPRRAAPRGAQYLMKYDKPSYRLFVHVSAFGPHTPPTTPPPTVGPGTPTPVPVSTTKLKLTPWGVEGQPMRVTIEDLTGGIPRRDYGVGDVLQVKTATGVEPWRIVRITPSSVFVELPNGSVRELKEVHREKFNY